MSEDEAELHKVEFVQRAREIPGTLQQSFRATHGSWPEGERSWTIIAKDYVGLTSAVIDNAVPRKLGKYHHQQQHLVYKDGSDDDFDKTVFCFQMCNMTSVIMITIIIFGPWELKHSAWEGWF